jgi:hypothetical protein
VLRHEFTGVAVRSDSWTACTSLLRVLSALKALSTRRASKAALRSLADAVEDTLRRSNDVAASLLAGHDSAATETATDDEVAARNLAEAFGWTSGGATSNAEVIVDGAASQHVTDPSRPAGAGAASTSLLHQPYASWKATLAPCGNPACSTKPEGGLCAILAWCVCSPDVFWLCRSFSSLLRLLPDQVLLGQTNQSLCARR